MIRTFIAIPISDDVKKSLNSVQRELSEHRKDIKAVNSDNMHITMKFLGDIEKDLIPELSGVIDEVASEFKPFEFVVSKLGAFPSSKKARVLWAGIGNGGNTMIDMEKTLSDKLVDLGFDKEKRPFTPHITIGRLKRIRRDDNLRKYLESNRGVDLGEDTCDRVELMKSTLTPEGAIYDELHTVYL